MIIQNFYFGLLFQDYLYYYLYLIYVTCITSNIYYITYDIETNKLVESSFMDETS